MSLPPYTKGPLNYWSRDPVSQLVTFPAIFKYVYGLRMRENDKGCSFRQYKLVRSYIWTYRVCVGLDNEDTLRVDLGKSVEYSLPW